ncbi:hypothetical protein DFJ67_5224 [Asanoa ferruginea]|uniref:Uncharacterized protein n=1 Tax=Asanoa ferruginea TaxID=53367 RepID=A0A3D9ZPU4_9ACTN|nr:hypothetical protein [Asanoa ferruginea]REF99197.1 hypothetical protein DFJ67_5224 [Asanoa ferruginea]GIF45789.1 hypothetical protein Afe04nite_03280 [Asanoa ferruginea]
MSLLLVVRDPRQMHPDFEPNRGRIEFVPSETEFEVLNQITTRNGLRGYHILHAALETYWNYHLAPAPPTKRSWRWLPWALMPLVALGAWIWGYQAGR